MTLSKEEDSLVIDGDGLKGHLLLYREGETWMHILESAENMTVRNWTGMSCEFYDYLTIRNVSLWKFIKIRLFRQKYKSIERKSTFLE